MAVKFDGGIILGADRYVWWQYCGFSSSILTQIQSYNNRRFYRQSVGLAIASLQGFY